MRIRVDTNRGNKYFYDAEIEVNDNILYIRREAHILAVFSEWLAAMEVR